MTRISMPSRDAAPAGSQAMLDQVAEQFGDIPNFIRVLAVAPAALEAFLGFQTIANKGVLEPAMRERIALAVSELNGCQYCVSAHSALAASIGLEPDEVLAARRGQPADARSAAVVAFARALSNSMGEVTGAEFDAAKAALTDEEIVEVIVHVGLTLLTNLLGKSTGVPIDFPEVSLLKSPEAR